VSEDVNHSQCKVSQPPHGMACRLGHDAPSGWLVVQRLAPATRVCSLPNPGGAFKKTFQNASMLRSPVPPMPPRPRCPPAHSAHTSHHEWPQYRRVSCSHLLAQHRPARVVLPQELVEHVVIVHLRAQASPRHNHPAERSRCALAAVTLAVPESPGTAAISNARRHAGSQPPPPPHTHTRPADTTAHVCGGQRLALTAT
jgi:hypothetical protein